MGILTIEDALESAQESGFDLIEISPNSNPPVCKLLDYGKVKYEQKKKEHLSKKKQHVIKLKEIRIRPRIDNHELETKMNMGKKLLNDGLCQIPENLDGIINLSLKIFH